MSLIRNKKAVEALPLRYIIIALVAAIVVGIALQFTGILKTGILSTAEKINESTTTQTTCALDTEKPIISNDGTTCADDNLNVKVSMTDACGINADANGFYTSATGSVDYFLELDSGTIKDGTWTFSANDTNWDGKTVSITAWAEDKASTPNKGTKTFNVTCS